MDRPKYWDAGGSASVKSPRTFTCEIVCLRGARLPANRLLKVSALDPSFDRSAHADFQQ